MRCWLLPAGSSLESMTVLGVTPLALWGSAQVLMVLTSSSMVMARRENILQAQGARQATRQQPLPRPRACEVSRPRGRAVRRSRRQSPPPSNRTTRRRPKTPPAVVRRAHAGSPPAALRRQRPRAVHRSARAHPHSQAPPARPAPCGAAPPGVRMTCCCDLMFLFPAGGQEEVARVSFAKVLGPAGLIAAERRTSRIVR